MYVYVYIYIYIYVRMYACMYPCIGCMNVCMDSCMYVRMYVCMHTVQSKSFRTDFFKNQRHIRKTHTFFLIQNKLHWHIYRLLCGGTVSEKLPNIPVFGPSLIHQLWLLGSQQYPQNGVFLTSFSTWGTQNCLVEINLESTGG